MIVVSNTSPIINLAIIGKLELLKNVFGKIIIPQAVYDEINAGGVDGSGILEVQSSKWIKVQSVKNENLVQSLGMELDKGEAETIAVALELKADFVLLDEKIGRKIAKDFGLKIV